MKKIIKFKLSHNILEVRSNCNRILVEEELTLNTESIKNVSLNIESEDLANLTSFSDNTSLDYNISTQSSNNDFCGIINEEKVEAATRVKQATNAAQIISEKNQVTLFADQYYHARGSLTEKIKNAVYQVFAQHNLPTIKSTVGGWIEWKKLPTIEWAFEHLDNQIDILDFDSKTFMEIILEKVFSNGSPSNNLTAFTMAVIVLFLDPHSGTVEMNKRIVALKMIIYLNELNEEEEFD
ncbi:hypothetical protein C1645_812958 [Glomus cerebriforme]|uniref:Uncharacterized protein n=1 Tax=Glomus cerebriforme TaxID=658196 RepID=A0A397TT47_9GLOM|nr:hypothetical protein C1645_812958 [Glomus cerebriforme]